MQLLTQRPRGTIDVLPADSHRWHHVESAVHRVCADFGFAEIRTPLFEHAELYLRSTGETSDILEKETYTFEDRGGRELTLRPEGTPGAVRAFLENGLHNAALPAKMYYLGPMFRYDRPQAGRYRQHVQFGVELFGAAGPEADLEVIMTAVTFFRRLGLSQLAVHLNSIGCPACRPGYREALLAHYRAAAGDLCPTCRHRMERNPLRLLDCKEPGCRPLKETAPSAAAYLCSECDEHFAALRGLLTRFGLDYQIDPLLVRGLDYYTKTVFELIHTGLGGAGGTVCGGGRYDGLMAAMGGPSLPGVGFGLGMERAMLALEKEGITTPPGRGVEVFLASVPAGDATVAEALRARVLELLYALRDAGIAAEADLLGRSLPKQLRYASRRGAGLVVVVGPDELAANQAKLRVMASGEEQVVGLEELVERARAALVGA